MLPDPFGKVVKYFASILIRQEGLRPPLADHFLARVSSDLLALFIEHRNPRLIIQTDNQAISRVEQGVHKVPLAFEVPFGFNQLGDVMGNSHHCINAAGFIHDRLDTGQVTISPPLQVRYRFVDDSFAAGKHFSDVSHLRICSLPGEQVPHRFAFEVGRLPTEARGCHLVHEQELSIPVYTEDRLLRTFDKTAITILTPGQFLFGSLPLGDVAEQTLHTDDLTRLIPVES